MSRAVSFDLDDSPRRRARPRPRRTPRGPQFPFRPGNWKNWLIRCVVCRTVWVGVTYTSLNEPAECPSCSVRCGEVLGQVSVLEEDDA